MADKKHKARQGRQDLLDQGASGERNRQDGSDGSRQSGFLPSSPDANVFPAGSPQSDRGDAGSRAGASAAGTPDEGKLGGSGGTSASGTTGNDPDR
jgi:hypothetical protein